MPQIHSKPIHLNFILLPASRFCRVVEVGDLGYWSTGKAFCIFFGQTPVSKPGKIMPASAVNIVGKVIGDATQFKKVMNESQVTLEAV